ncbi:MAG: redoxin domain-containing protein [Planctomycetota bacterium]
MKFKHFFVLKRNFFTQMKKQVVTCLLFCFSVLPGCSLFSTQTSPPLQPLSFHQKFPPFSLLNNQGQAISLNSFYMQKMPVIFFFRTLEQDQEWLKNLKTLVKEFYLEGCVIFAIYPENQVSAEEIEAFKLPVHFLADSQNQTAKKYHVYNAVAQEPYFAIFYGDFAFRCQFQQAVTQSEDAISPTQLFLQINQQQKKSTPETPKKR